MVTYAGRGLHGSTVETLGRRIVSGVMPEGSLVDVPALQREFDVSLTVMREALRVLAAKGLIGARQKRGTFVLQRSSWHLLDRDVIRWLAGGTNSPRFIDDLNELRAIVEPPSVRLAAHRRTDADLAALDACLREMASAHGDPAAVTQADLRFHRALLAATHNELLAGMEVVIRSALAERDRLVHHADPIDDPVPSHRAVLDAVRAADPDRAEQAMRELLHKAVEDVRHLGSPPRPRSGPAQGIPGAGSAMRAE